MAHRSRRWFHPALSGKAAAELLITAGSQGSFLIRPSESNPRTFVMCVRDGPDVFMMRIENTGDFFQFDQVCEEQHLEQFPSLQELVDFYQSEGEVQVLQDGSLKMLKLQSFIPCTDHSHCWWYHGLMGKADACEKIASVNHDGVFLVYCNAAQEANTYNIVVRWNKKVLEAVIEHEDNQFSYNGKHKHSSLLELIEHHQTTGLEITVDGEKADVYLTQPYRYTEFPIMHISEHIVVLQKPKGGSLTTALEDEFQHLDDHSPHFSSSEGQRPENKSKNRYGNILPFNHSRITLRCLRGPEEEEEIGDDYINASAVQVARFGVNKSYIVAQGCLPSTEHAFWEMVWQQNCEVIVMATGIIEGGKVKCMKYWPDLNDTSTYPTLTVTCISVTEKDGYVVREFSLKKAVIKRRHSLLSLKKMKGNEDKTARTVTQFMFKAWPDHGIPANPDMFLGLLKEIRSHQQKAQSSPHPLLVHCSAGIGRSGVVVALDMLLDIVNQSDPGFEISVQEVVRHIRFYRSGLVQSCSQYEFIYIALERYIMTTTRQRDTW